MTEQYIVAGANWICEVPVDEYLSELPEKDQHIEVCTQAVERHFKKRLDLSYTEIEHRPIKESKGRKDELLEAIIELVKDEIEPKCGIGALLVIMKGDLEDEESLNDPDKEWYVNSRLILNNAGFPHLAKKFDEKFPSLDPKTS